MNRFSFLIVVALCAGVARADDRTPEQLLSPTTQIYARWDGVSAHKSAYARSARGKVFAGDAGKCVDELMLILNRQAKKVLVGDRLLEGTPPPDLQQLHADVKRLLQMPGLLADKGIVAGFEMGPPVFDLRTLFEMARGERKPFELQYQLTLIVPDAADQPEIAAAMRVLGRYTKESAKEEMIAGRKVVMLAQQPDNVKAAAWAEGKHAVFVYGNHSVDAMVQKVKDCRTGITTNPNYKRLQGFKEFRVVTRGFVESPLKPFEKFTKQYAPEVWPRLELAGLTGIHSAYFWDGFDGEESRGVVEIEFSGKRQGLTRLFRPEGKGAVRPAPLRMSDLPPLPADLTRFTAARLDPGAIYELLPLLDMAGPEQTQDDEGLSPEQRLRSQRDKTLASIDEALGIKMAELFSALDDRVVTYHAPGDGMLFSQVIAVGVKDEKLLNRCVETLRGKLPQLLGKEVAVKRRDCLGIEIYELSIQGNGFVVLSFTVCDGWLVVGFQPQPVRGFIHRSRGKLPSWKPDPRTAATLAKLPNDRCVLQVADPRASIQWLLTAAPLVTGVAAGFNPEKETLLDPGIFPHAGEVNSHLFPNVCWCRDDGKTMRWESRDSLWLPLEFLGPELITTPGLYGVLAIMVGNGR